MSRDVSVGNVFGYEMFMFIFTYALQAFKAYCAIWVRRSPPGFSTRVTTRQHPAAKGGTVGEKCPVILPKCRLTPSDSPVWSTALVFLNIKHTVGIIFDSPS